MFKTLKSLMKRAYFPKAEKYDFPSQTSKKALAAKLLSSRGSITTFELQNILRTTDAQKIVSDLRKMGFIHCSEDKTNKKTGARYRVHHWSGKTPTFKAAK